jgi:hypothetical protein
MSEKFKGKCEESNGEKFGTRKKDSGKFRSCIQEVATTIIYCAIIHRSVASET